MKRKIIWLVVNCLIVLALLATSCTKAVPTPTLALENTVWVLQSYSQPGNLKSVLKDAEVTVLFDSAKGQVTGSAGINRYFGAYKLDGNKLVISGMGSTMMAGPQPMMDQETEFLISLQAAESYQVEGDKLTITCGGKVLIFAKKVTTSIPVPALENTDWVLESYGEAGTLQSALPDKQITARFDSTTAQVGGSAGVNRYFGAYKLDGTKLTIPGPMGSTAMAGPQPLMDQEREFLKSLQVAESYKIDGDKLTITCGGKVLIFIKK